MFALGLCVASLAIVWAVTRRSVTFGIIALLTVSYFYGIARANTPGTYSHFIVDAALIGFYMAAPWGRYFADERLATLRSWMMVLTGWPALMFLLPQQPLMVQLVGLRGHIFFLPMMLIGAALSLADLRKICVGLAVLNVAAFCFAVGEYVLGVPRFYPLNAVTLIIYVSADVAGGFFRIPAIFSNAHSYAGTMVATLPFLIGALYGGTDGKWRKLLMCIGIVVAIGGVLMASTRMYFVLCAMLIAVAAFSSGAGKNRLIMMLVIAVGAWVALTNPRFQRFKSLDAEGFAGRIHGSVNRNLLEIVLEYPLGNGLGGAGTSLPYFLAGQVRNPIGVENEYGRFALEQGVPGLALWVCFIAWFTTQRQAFWRGAWKHGRLLAWCLTLWGFASAAIGTGMLTAIPGTFLFLLTLGWLTVPESHEQPSPVRFPAPDTFWLHQPHRLSAQGF